ncbi:MAG TPA: glutamate-cysteine ligase family protein [Planctomicrobium sp.]|nr:glutamate-cysteine ligase family protein [Planctomicrobium sp.]
MSLHLFDAVGIELEYMIVDAASLDVRPIADHVLRDDQGNPVSDVDQGLISWSNELASHVIELKTNGPVQEIAPLAAEFQKNIQTLNRQFTSAHARLLPTAMHPWMDPDREMQLWPHEYSAVYHLFDQIFNCRGHGWANLQSMHINLPFSGDEEFGRLHAAIRLILPLLPGLAASSPVKEGVRTGVCDTRLDVYRSNAKAIPSVSGRVIPEQAYDSAAYDREVFQPMFRDIAPYDPEGLLQEEFLNARGAIARFGRGSIEIRVLDVQECPQADLAIAALTIAVLKMLVEETWTSTVEQQSVTIDSLEPILLAAIQYGDEAIVSDANVLRHFGCSATEMTLSGLWRELYVAASERDPELFSRFSAPIETILTQGCLAHRILKELNGQTGRHALHEVYQRLAECLETGESFRVVTQ